MPNDTSNFTTPDVGGQYWDPVTGTWKSGSQPTVQGADANGFSNSYSGMGGAPPRTLDGSAPSTGKVGVYEDGSGGAIWGGYSGTMVLGPDGKPVFDPTKSGANEDINRFRGLGAAAANREAYRNDYTQANSDAMLGEHDRAQQGIAANLARDTALNGDAQSQMLGRSMLDQGVQSQVAAAGSARGGALAQAAAMRQQQNGQGAFMQQGNNALMAQRADDMASGRSQYMQDMTAMRAGDAEAQRLKQQQAIEQMKNELDQRNLNQTGRMGYEAMAQGVHKAANSAILGTAEIKTGIDAAASARASAAANRDAIATANAVGAVGTGVAKLADIGSGTTSASTGGGTKPGWTNSDGTPISGAGGGYDPDDPGSDERLKTHVRSLAAASMMRRGMR